VLLTVLAMLQRRLSGAALMWIVRVPARPSRLKPISMPSVRRNVCARRSRPASDLGVLGQSALLREASLLTRSAVARRRSEAVPVHVMRSAMRSRTQTATRSLSMTLPDGGPAVRLIGAQEGASGPECCFACHCPKREIGHPRQSLGANVRQLAQAMRRSVEQGTQDARPRGLEFAPEVVLRAPLLRGDRR
jgi:hypothetical protein